MNDLGPRAIERLSMSVFSLLLGLQLIILDLFELDFDLAGAAVQP